LSSILRALKKLESEPRHLEKTQRVDHKYISLAGPQRRSSAFRPLLLFIGGGIACGMVLLTGWWFMYERVQPDAPSIQESLTPASSMDTPLTEPENPSPIAVQEQPASQSSALSTPATIIADQAPIVKIVPVADEAPVEQISPEPTAKKEIITTAAVLPETLAETKGPEIPLLSDPDVKLQSISWSKKPQKRLAVISNRIVREGGMVSGYLLVTINKDDVILSQNREKWRITFRIK